MVMISMRNSVTVITHAQLMHNVSDMFIVSHSDIVIHVSLWPRVPVQMFHTYFLNFEISM